MRKSGCNRRKLRVRARPRNGGISRLRPFLKMGASTADCIWRIAELIPELLNHERNTIMKYRLFRKSVVLATKYSNAAPGNDPNAAGNHRKSMMQAVEASLKRLQTDYIDLYWVHIWDEITPVEEVMRGLDDLVRQGKILYAGISDAPAWWVAQANP